MRFRLLDFMLIVGAAGAALGLLLKYAFAPEAIIVVILIGIATSCAFLAKNRWPHLSIPEKVYGVTAVVAPIVAIEFILVLLVSDVTFARYRLAQQIQSALARHPRLSGVRIEYFEGKEPMVSVYGTVSTESDFQELRQNITKRDWRGTDQVYWDVLIELPNFKVEGWDSKLFGNGAHDGGVRRAER